MVAARMKRNVERWVRVVVHLIRCLLGVGALAGWVLCYLLTPLMATLQLHPFDALPGQVVDVPDDLGQWCGMAASPTQSCPRYSAGWLARGHAGEPTGLHPGPGPPGRASWGSVGGGR